MTGWRRHRLLMSAPHLATAGFATPGYNLVMARLRRFYDANHLHFVTTSTYRRSRVFDSDRFKRKFITSLADLRAELGFRIIGYVLMPEHCHLLLWPSESANPSSIVQRGTRCQVRPEKPPPVPRVPLG